MFIVAESVDRFIKRRPVDLDLHFLSDLRSAVDPVFMVFVCIKKAGF